MVFPRLPHANTPPKKNQKEVSMRSWIFLPALGLSCALLAVDPATAQTYTVTDLGVLPGQDFSEALGINNSGDVIGFTSVMPDGVPLGYPVYSFLYRDGKPLAHPARHRFTPSESHAMTERTHGKETKEKQSSYSQGMRILAKTNPMPFSTRITSCVTLAFCPGASRA
jgi:hypothetical protein